MGLSPNRGTGRHPLGGQAGGRDQRLEISAREQAGRNKRKKTPAMRSDVVCALEWSARRSAALSIESAQREVGIGIPGFASGAIRK